MFTHLDVFAFLLCASVWLGPLLYNLSKGHCRLLHPIGYFPLIMTYMLVPPLWYRWDGTPMLKTAASMALDPWFLAEPMMLLALAGVFYHLGVRASGTRLALGPADRVDACVHLPVICRVPTAGIVISSAAAMGLAVAAILLRSRMEVPKGFFWVNVAFSSINVIPLLVFQQHRLTGLLFVLAAMPTLLFLSGSKAAFLYVPISFLVFYDRKILDLSKTLTVVLVGCVLATPIAVAMYGSSTRTLDEVREARQIASWDMAIEHIGHREYAFEAFACVYQWRREGEPYHLGAMLSRELLDVVPAAFWPDKPEGVSMYDFPESYLPNDYDGRPVHYARHLMTPFFLDFGVVGVCLATLLAGLVYGSAYRIARNASLRRGDACWLLVYFPLMFNAKYFVEGSLGGGVPCAIGQAVLLGATMWLSFHFFGVPGLPRPRRAGANPRILRPWSSCSPANSRR
jgi:hypothetical protein